MRITPLLFLDAAAILLALIFTALIKGSSLDMPVALIVYAICAFIIIRLIVAGLVQTANSALSDGMKFCWTLLILLLPIFGPIACLIVIDKKRI